MTDAEWLTLLLAVVYLIECVSIVPAQAVMIRSRGPHSGRILRPILILPGIDRAVIVSNPLDLLSKEFIVVDSHVIATGERLLVIDNLGGRYLRSLQSPARGHASGQGSGNNWLGRQLAAENWLEAQFQRLGRASRFNSAVASLRIDRQAARQISQAVAILEKRLAVLVIWTLLQASTVLLVFPVLMFWKGILPALASVVPIIAVAQILICTELYRLRRRYFRDSIVITLLQLVPVFLFPLGAIRSAVGFARRVSLSYHPVVARYALIKTERATAEVTRHGRWLVYALDPKRFKLGIDELDSRVGQAWRRREIRDLNLFLQPEGVNLRSHIRRSDPQEVSGKFCPLCLTEYDEQFTQCLQCGNIPLKRPG
jgi:hypothetical protein